MGKKNSRHPKKQQPSRGPTNGKNRKLEQTSKSLNSNDVDLLQPIGLLNLGNTCYFNSTVQSIACVRRYLHFKIKYFLGPYESSVGPVTNALMSLLSKIKQCTCEETNLSESSTSSIKTAKVKNGYSSLPSINPSSLLSRITSSCPQFQGRSQQDAHELFICLMNSLKEEHEKCMKCYEDKSNLQEQSKSDVMLTCLSYCSNYDGKLASRVKCDSCETNCLTSENFFDISLPIPGSESFMSIRHPPYLFKSKGKKIEFSASSQSKPTQQKKVNSKVDINVENAPRIGAPQEDFPQEDVHQEEMIVVKEVESRLNNLSLTQKVDCVDTEKEDHPNHITPAVNETLISTSDSTDNDSLNPSNDHQISRKNASNKLSSEDVSEPTMRPLRSNDNLSNLSIYDCLDLYTREEHLLVGNDNGYRCDSCNFLTNAKRRIFFTELPHCVVIHLKRLLPGGKYDKHIHFPVELDLSAYLADVKDKHISRLPSQETVDSHPRLGNAEIKIHYHSKQTNNIDDDAFRIKNANDRSSIPPETNQFDHVTASKSLEDNCANNTSNSIGFTNLLNNTENQLKGNRRISSYRLVSVIVHQGSGRGGHYVSYVKRKSQWYYTSDTTVKMCSEKDVLACQAYMLFYVRNLETSHTENIDRAQITENES